MKILTTKMKKSTDHIEKYRVLTGPMASTSADGMNGAFMIPVRGCVVGVVVSNGRDWEEERLPLPKWEHVSVSLKGRIPLWYEMQAVKDLFWEPEELAVQFHVPKADHINVNENVLHLWRPVGIEIPVPPKECV